ncbi:MAG: Gfo/Idh/MocA family oxidoreductase [Oscillospiraceae bacterium]|nr:Gfo/Idh/MocA family oxidoreductase [Oscillospiraceae bacterium]
MRKLNVGFVGLGGRGRGILNMVLAMDDVEVKVVCDMRQERLEMGLAACKEKYGYDVAGTLNHKEAVARDDIEAVIIPSSWNDHLKIARDAMEAGKYAAFEVGPAQNVNECWEMIRTYERTGVPCMILENCCYGRYELTVLNMIKKGLFGELIHAQGGYEHDLRGLARGTETELERTYHYIHRNGELYPTHELGPIMSYLSINRGNRMLTLTAMASKSRGLRAYIDANLGGTDYLKQQNLHEPAPFQLGDIVTTMIRCAHGETIILTHDTTLPRPYSRGGRIQGTKGLWMEDNDSIYIEGRSPDHTWEPMSNYWAEYEHPLWKEFYKNIKGGHGGMDYLVMRGFLEAVRNKVEPPIDVYNSMSMIIVSCLSEESIAMGGAPVAIPDFTDGKWIKRSPGPKSIFSLTEVHDDLFTADTLEI